MTPAPKAGWSTPLLHVAEVERSLHFYGLLGFATVDTEGADGRLGWARMHCEGGALMLLRASEPVRPADQDILLYMYANDLAGLREHLLAHGVRVSSIRFPEYMPSGEMRLDDPDGYVVLVAHWGQAEHEAWERKLEEKRRSRGGC